MVLIARYVPSALPPAMVDEPIWIKAEVDVGCGEPEMKSAVAPDWVSWR